MSQSNSLTPEESTLLDAIKGEDKKKALELAKLATREDVKPHHLEAAIKEYYQESNNLIASIVRPTAGLVVKALAEKSSDEALLKNQKYKIKDAVYEIPDDGMPDYPDLVKKAKYAEVKVVTAELKKRGIGTSNHADAIAAQASTKSHER